MVKTKLQRNISSIEVKTLTELCQTIRKLPAKAIIDIKDENDKSRIPVVLKSAKTTEHNLEEFFDNNDLGRSCLDFRYWENFSKTKDQCTFDLVFWYNP